MRAALTRFIDDLLVSLDLVRHFHEVEALTAFLRDARESGGTTYFLGNGASASISSTLAFKALSEQGVPALAINDHNLLLGTSRKKSFGEWMARTAETLLKPGDALVLTSSSGESPNVVNLAKLAQKRGVALFSLTGFEPSNQLRNLSDSGLWVDSRNYNVVETAHLLLGLIAVRGLELSRLEVEEDFQRCVEELNNLDWGAKIEQLNAFSDELAGIDFQSNRIVFVGDGSSASLASHLATDFSKSGLTSQAMNDHSFLSAAQNDFGSVDWISVGVERSYRPGDTVIFVSHGHLFPAEKKAIESALQLGASVAHHGTVPEPVDLPDHRQLTYSVMHPASELVAPSIGLLAIAEAFLDQKS